MERKYLLIPLAKNADIQMKAIPGHFATNRKHLSHYLDLYDLKTNVALAREVAREMALPYIHSTLIDTIVCMEGTEVIGAFLAEELQLDGASIVNSDNDIHVLTPMSNVDRKLMFLSDGQDLISNRNALILLSSISSGTTLNSVIELLNYYGANIVGISALFNAYQGHSDMDIHSIFTADDIPGYKIHEPVDCPLCEAGEKLDALIFHDGLLRLQ